MMESNGLGKYLGIQLVDGQTNKQLCSVVGEQLQNKDFYLEGEVPFASQKRSVAQSNHSSRSISLYISFPSPQGYNSSTKNMCIGAHGT
ncbi:hypothetical protein Scep_027800 [Stephania cephalantha]|uniref:Uncharacterized protein n=1 Tax=Stephania cephalantha TaxID=152367 RepID=A0AAP0EG36_9MAGN